MLHAVGKVQQAFLCAYVLNDRGNCVVRLLHLPDRFSVSIFQNSPGNFAFRISHFPRSFSLKKVFVFQGNSSFKLVAGQLLNLCT